MVSVGSPTESGRTISVQMQDALKHADKDLEHAQGLYNSVAPFLNGMELAEKVSQERDVAQKTLAAAQQAQSCHEGTP